MKSEKWKMKGERWKAKSEKRKVKSEKWKAKSEKWNKSLLMVNILYNILSIFSFFSNDHKKSIMCKNDGQKVTAMTTIITPQITPYRRQNGVTLPWRIPEMALLQKSLCNGLVTVQLKMKWDIDEIFFIRKCIHTRLRQLPQI